MTREEKLELLDTWQCTMKYANDVMAIANKAIGLDVDGHLNTVISSLKETTTLFASTCVGDKDTWLSWHHLENNFGEKALAAAVSGNDTKPIKTLDDLLDLIEGAAA